MSKITVIQLLNKIANGEAPRKIKYKEKIYEKDSPKAEENGYVCIDKYGYYHWLNSDVEIDDINNLNDEVEIIEEDKKIGKLYLNDEYLFSNNLSKEFTREDRRLLDSNFKELGNKINEIIDVINKGDK